MSESDDSGVRRTKPNRLTVQPENKPKKQEERVARTYGGERHRASGALPGAAGDVSVGDLSLAIEAKHTKFSGFYVTPDMLQKICREALASNQDPALTVHFEGQAPPVPKDWIMLPEDVFLRLIGKAP